MDRRNSNHAKLRRARELIRCYESEKLAVEELKNDAKKEEEKLKSLYEMNSLWLACSAIEDMKIEDMPEELSVVEKCNGCPNCNNTNKSCFTVIVNK